MGDSASGIDASLTACTLAGLGLVVPGRKTHAQQHEHNSLAISSNSLAKSANLLLPKGHAKTVLEAVSIRANLHQISPKNYRFWLQGLLKLAA